MVDLQREPPPTRLENHLTVRQLQCEPVVLQLQREPVAEPAADLYGVTVWKFQNLRSFYHLLSFYQR